jgi:hypothetical protein
MPKGGRFGTGTIPSSIAADESRDVTADLNAYFARQPANAVVAMDPRARYRLDGTLVVPVARDTTLTIHGFGALLHWPNKGQVGADGQSHRKQIVVQGEGTPLWDGLKLLGPIGDAPTRPGFDHVYEDEKGLVLQGTVGAVIDHPVIHGTWGDCLAVSEYHPPAQSGKGAPPAVATADAHVLSPVFGTCADGAFANAHEFDGVTIEDGDFRHIARAAIDLEMPASNFALRRSKFADIGLSWVGMAGLGRVVGVELSDNVVEDEGLFAKFGPSPGAYSNGSRDSDFVLQRNRSLVEIGGGTNPVFAFRGVSGVRLVGNVQHYSSSRASGAVAIGGTTDPRDTDYYAEGNDFAGVGSLWPTPADPTWVDGGGNIL